MKQKSSVARYQRLNRPQYGKGSRKSRNAKGDIWRITLALLVIGIGYLGWKAYSIYTSPAGRHAKTVYILVDKQTDMVALRQQIQTKIWPQYPRLLDHLISYYDIDQKLKPGRYAVTPRMTTLDLVQTLNRGEQTPVKLNLKGIRTESELIERLDNFLMLSREEIEQSISDTVLLSTLKMNREEVRSLFFADTYEVLWNITAQDLIDTMRRHHDRYWTAERRGMAQSLGLTTAQVATLASIVESESAKRDEYSRIAGLYLNRLHRGMMLQSDPTVIFGVGDFSIRRVLGQHLAHPSPYNTYKFKGLPPGPIRLPNASTIDYILKAEQHNYIYMCARETFDGYHNFSSDYGTHLVYARRYQQALNKRQGLSK